MSTLTMAMASPNSLKRSYDESGLGKPDHILSAPSDQIPLPSVEEVPIQPSDVAPSANPATKGSAAPNDSSPCKTDMTGMASSVATAQAPAKKHKLTLQEKEIKKIEKEFKEREKAEAKAKKEEERELKGREKAEAKAKKDEEKAKKGSEKTKKEEEKMARKKVKEDQRKAKDEEKRLKEEEQNKKSRNQTRLNSFFIQPSLPNSKSSGSPSRDVQSPLGSRRSSISGIQAMEAARRSRSISTTPQKAKISDYERIFLSFELLSESCIAPYNHFLRDKKDLSHVRDVMDEKLKGNIEPDSMSKGLYQCDFLEKQANQKNQRSLAIPSVKRLMEEIEGTSSRPIDLTKSKDTRTPLDLLTKVPMKYLSFAEDVRPPYFGTCTRLQDARSITKLARNPFERRLPNTNYDYDSEAEWEEPLEGEDLDSEGEEEAEDEEDGDEMAGFLDDEGATDLPRALKRRPILGNQEPVCTGLCWEGPNGEARDSGLADLDWRLLKLDVLLDDPKLPIDPYSTTYWLPKQITSHSQSTLMEPPRIPLHPVNRQTTLTCSPNAKTLDESNNDISTRMKHGKAPRPMPPELLEEFKNAVQGNDLTKVGLLEILKKKFPKQSKDTIKDTLETIAERVGLTPAEKKWILKDGV
ncbi:chromatin assembly factor-I (CAF-I) p90 subunit [Lecanora helva]